LRINPELQSTAAATADANPRLRVGARLGACERVHRVCGFNDALVGPACSLLMAPSTMPTIHQSLALPVRHVPTPSEHVTSAAMSSMLSDQRGAILVPAIAMGALLVGALYYVASVGDAIVFRTQLQDAADTTAFTGAVWHARGMNMLVVLNVIMSIALGVFALIRIVEVIVLILALIPPLFPVFSQVFRTLVTNVERPVFTGVNTALEVTSALQSGVSSLVPWVGFGAAKGTPTAADTIWPMSMSMLPPIPTPPALQRKMPGNFGKNRLPEKGPGALPVQQDEFGTLCSKGFMIIPKQLVAWIDSMNIPFVGDQLKETSDAILNDVARKVLGAGDGIFCQPAAGMIGKLLELLSEKVCGFADSRTESAEQAVQDEEDRVARENGQDSGRNRNRGGSSGGGSCLGPLGSLLGELTDKNMFTVSSAAMWAPAANGSPTTHIWSYAQATPRMWQTDQKGVARAANGKASPDIGDIPGSSALGEFYFDCAAGWEHACEWDAMWAPGWTARLRRYRPPARELADVGLNTIDVTLDEFERGLGEIIGEKAGEAFHTKTGLPAEGPVSSIVTAFMDTFKVSELYDKFIVQNIENARESSGINEILNPRDAQNPHEVH